MRILHIDTGMVMRGGQELLMMTARGLRTRGHDQTIACPPGSSLEKMAAAEGFSVLTIERPYGKAVRTIRRELRRQPYDLVSAHDARAQTVSFLATLGLRNNGQPVIRVANRLVVFQPRNLFTHRLKYKYTCDIVVALSSAVKATLVPQRHSGRTRRRSSPAASIFRNELGRHAGARERMRARWGFAADDFVIGHIAGNFTAEKGQLNALDALLALLPRRIRICACFCAEDGPLREEDPRTQEKRLGDLNLREP